MKRISEATADDISTLFQDIIGIMDPETAEYAAQRFTDIFYHYFRESVVLARIFATVPFGDLPSDNQQFVTELASSLGIAHLMRNNTPVLSLLGTSGQHSQWNDRRKSKGHMGIPLASGDVVDSIPMMSRLLSELGLGLNWIDDWDTQIVSTSVLASFTGMFYVEDASTWEDNKGRKIIVAQGFVAEYRVKSVIGFGVRYVGIPHLAVLIAFLRERIGKWIAREFSPLMEAFRIVSQRPLKAGKFFSA